MRGAADRHSNTQNIEDLGAGWHRRIRLHQAPLGSSSIVIVVIVSQASGYPPKPGGGRPPRC